VTPSRAAVRIGHATSILVSLLLLFSAAMKARGGPELAKGFDHLGLPAAMVMPLSVLEAACTVLYLIPAFSIVGTILLTGYIGGAICTHWRVGDPVVAQIILGLLVWLGAYLREPRLRILVPLRRS
jgi:hypothetical protein